MFWHHFNYSLKTLLKNKMLIFWTFIFPIVLGTFFYLAFSNIENSEKLDTINIAIVDNQEFKNQPLFQKTFKTLGNKKSKDQLFDISYVDLSKAKEELKQKKIIGYLLFKQGQVYITVSESGIEETVLRLVVEEVQSNQDMMENLSKQEIKKQIEQGNIDFNPKEIYDKVISKIEENTVLLKDVSSSNLSYTMIEFYTLIAMTCLYGGILAMYIINYQLANMNCIGKRIAISPVHKIKMLLGGLFASYMIQLVGLLILFIYTIFVLHVDYGNHLFLIIFLSCVGSFAGLSLGVVVGTFKTNENVKIGILISITMLGCFLSGMMGITMKYIIDKNIPIINQINPASMITDGFYALYYYETLDRFIFDVISLLIFSVVMILISYHGLRRQRYDSI